MKAYGGMVDVLSHFSLTSAIVRVQWSASHPGRFTPEERALAKHWIVVWVGPRTGLDDVEKTKFLTLSGLELRPLCRPAHSQSLYRLRYPGSYRDNTPSLKREDVIMCCLGRAQFVSHRFPNVASGVPIWFSSSGICGVRKLTETVFLRVLKWEFWSSLPILIPQALPYLYRNVNTHCQTTAP
jgi:hypothetical protein